MTGPRSDRYVRSTDVLQRRCPDRVLVLAPTGDVQVLAGSATVVWDALSVPMTVEEIVGELRGRFSGAPADLSTDIAELVSTLVQARTVEVHEGAAWPPS